MRERVKGDGSRRTCVGCRRVARPDELVRVHRIDGGLAVGPGPGRGAWLCAAHPRDCLERSVKRGGLARALRAPISTGDLERLRAKLEG